LGAELLKQDLPCGPIILLNWWTELHLKDMNFLEGLALDLVEIGCDHCTLELVPSGVPALPPWQLVLRDLLTLILHHS
jgi:hypothetical protein